tara:strand:- start:1176 stop:1313 length:138 start_codon:yes stop_codon:yes gene_type:complete
MGILRNRAKNRENKKKVDFFIGLHKKLKINLRDFGQKKASLIKAG